MKALQDLKVTWQNVPTRPITAGGVEFRVSGAVRRESQQP
jgi:hypothetical protein